MPTWSYVVMTVTMFMMIGVTQCEVPGDVRIVNDSVSYEGIVEVCQRINFFNYWTNVCADVYSVLLNRYIPSWGAAEATVVCRQLGYKQSDVQPLISRSPVLRGAYTLRNVNCTAISQNRTTLLDCDYSRVRSGVYCHLAAVRCRDSLNITNVRATIINTDAASTINTVDIRITWDQNTTVEVPTMFEVTCYNDRHSIEITVSNVTTTSDLGGLLHSSNYTCCVSAVYDLYTARSVCMVVETPTTSVSAPSTSNSSSVIGAVLGFIIILLLVLLAVSVVCLLRPGLRQKVLPTKLSQFVDSNSKSSSTLPVRANMSYITTPSSHSATENSSQNNRATDQGVTASSNPNYSSIGPAYETLSNTTARQHREEGGREIPISERYEFAEIHTDTDRRVQVGVSASDYEVPRESVHIGDEEYSRLQH